MRFEKCREVLEAIDPAASHTGEPPGVDVMYAPAGHESALDPERSLVVGDRGMGKTFWAWSLVGPDSKEHLDRIYPRLGLSKCEVSVGFAGEDMAPNGSISTEVFDQLQSRTEFTPELIWRVVILRAALLSIGQQLPGSSFREQTQWAHDDAERFQVLLRTVDSQIALSGRKVVVLFDALDRLGSNWAVIRTRTIALVRVALALRSYKGIKLKIFMRSDQAADPALFAFPDASKVFGARVELYWERRDLFGLAFSTLARTPASSDEFAELVRQHSLFVEPQQLPEPLKHDEDLQATIFTALAGPYMGSDWRKGKTYAWIHNHLSDAHGRVSPRSFLLALRAAAASKPAPIDRLFDPKGLQRGVQEASGLRVEQLGEEFPWISTALLPLADLRVPATKELLFSRWSNVQAPESIASQASHGGYLPPIEFGGTPPQPTSEGLLESLRRIGVTEERPDGRINMPDIYRVAAKLLRMGGIRPRR